MPSGDKSKKWRRGKGWGWIWGKRDEIGALNHITHESVRAALHAVRLGRIYDLGVRINRSSFRWPGHSPIETVTFRSGRGITQQRDIPAFAALSAEQRIGFNSTLILSSDHVGTQIDGLSHFTKGKDQWIYNGFVEDSWGGNWGVRKADADSIPPIVARGTLIDVAAAKRMSVLPSRYAITPKDLQQALEWEKVDIQVGDVVLIRTGLLSLWGECGENHERLAHHDSAGISLASARWLVQEKGAVLVGADNSAVEVVPSPDGKLNPVHVYLLVEQGVHMGEFHYLEGLSRDEIYKFTYVALTNRIQGTTAGFGMRPIAIT